MSDLDDLQGQPYMLRESDDPTSPWRNVATQTDSFWQEELPPATEGGGPSIVSFEAITIAFHESDAERVLNRDDDIEVGLIRPPWWPEGAKPNDEWPHR